MAIQHEIIKELKKKVAEFKDTGGRERIGTVLEVGDGVAKIAGLTDVGASEMLTFQCAGGEEVMGLALNLEEGQVGAVVLGQYQKVKEGDVVKGTGQTLAVPASTLLLGRVVNALLEPVDDKGAIARDAMMPVEKIAPGVIMRQPVTVPLHTGIMAIDAMIPIGRGQRELIIGDRQTGKTAIAIDTILNQKGRDVICIYVALGQRESKVHRVIGELEERGAMEYTTVVLAGAADPAAMIYIAPYAATALGEYFMSQGKDVLIVYDDLTKHAQAYRQVSLLLRRPPGREAYPGDVLYLHSRLLERACRLNEQNGGGSLTALPIIETQAGDVSAYIPTNVISITDGQIYLETDLFYQGVRPAISVGSSVSRVGGAAQLKITKKVAGSLRLNLAQYHELAAFAQFSSDLDAETRKQLEKGKRAIEMLKQGQYQPLGFEFQAVLLWALANGFMDEITPEKIAAWKEGLVSYLTASQKELLQLIAEKKELAPEVENTIRAALEEYQRVNI